MHWTQIQGIIEYIGNTINKEPGRFLETCSGELWNYVENTIDI